MIELQEGVVKTAAAGGAGAGRLEAASRLGCSLLTFRAWPLEEALDRVRAHGLDRIDLCLLPGHCDHADLEALAAGGAGALAEALRARALRPSSINLYPGNALLDPEGVARRVRLALEVGRRLGAPVLTLPPGPAVPEAEWPAAAGRVAALLRGLLDAAEASGVRLTIEAPHAHSLAPAVDDANRLFALVGDPRLGCTLDTSHLQRGHRRPLAEALARLAAPLAHVHLRDTRRGEVTFTPGKGDCDYGPFLAALAARGYRGDLAFELEYEAATPPQVERELDFAREHVGRLLAGAPLPLGHRLRRQGWWRAADAAAWAVANPRAFVSSRPGLKAVLRPPVLLARRLARDWVPYRTSTYRAGWATTWRVGHEGSRISPRPAPAAGPAPATRRVAILGCGYTGGFQHGPGFARLPGVEVVGVCDLKPERAGPLARTLGCPTYDGLEAMLAGARPDLVVNCTREWQHRDTTLACLAAGADVFCEKILAESLASGEAMVEAARARGRVLAVNFNWRFLPGVQRLRRLREEGELGPLRLLRVLAHAHVHHHALDLVEHLGGEVASVSAGIRDDPASRGLAAWNPYADELLYMPTLSCVAAMETRDGVAVSLSSSELLDPAGLLLAIDAVFQEGTVTLSGVLDRDALGTLTASARRPLDLSMPHADGPGRFALSFQRSIEAFMGSLRAGTAPPSSGADALRVMRLEHALVESHRRGARVAC